MLARKGSQLSSLLLLLLGILEDNGGCALEISTFIYNPKNLQRLYIFEDQDLFHFYGSTLAHIQQKQINYIAESESNERHIHLCNNPPNIFSPGFIGQTTRECSENGKILRYPFRKTVQICLDLYKSIHRKSEFRYGMILSDQGTEFIIFADNSLVKICLPLQKRFDLCESRGFLTICWESNIIIVQELPKCKRPSDEDKYFDIVLATYKFWGEEECFQQFCQGHLRLISTEVEGVQVEIMNPLPIKKNSSCDSLNNHLGYTVGEDVEILFTTNEHWPCCYETYTIAWFHNPEKNGINGSWDYLPLHCRIMEMILIIFVAFVTFSGIFSNLAVLIVMLRSKHRHEESTIIRTSLAMSDFFIAVFVATPSLYYHISPFIYSTEYSKTRTPIFGTVHNRIIARGTTLSFEGIIVLQGLVFSACHIVSLFCLLLLSMERFLLTGRPLKYRQYFTKGRIKVLIGFIWVFATIDTLLFSFENNGHFQVMYLSFEKLPVAINMDYSENDVLIVLKTSQFYLLYLMGLSTLIFSLLAIWNFLRRNSQIAAEWKMLNMRVTGPYYKENRYIFHSLILMLLFFLLSVVPRTLDVIFATCGYSFRSHVLFSYISWWLLMAGTAWNPWIYNMRSRQFRQDAIRILLPSIKAEAEST